MGSRFAGTSLILSLLLATVLTWPVVAELDASLMGSPDSDTMKHLWNLWFMKTEILNHGWISSRVEHLNFPEGLRIHAIEPLNGVMAAVLAGLPTVAAANVVALVNLTLTGLCGALLGREASGSVWGGLVAGLILESSAYTRFSIHVGAGELQHVWLLPLGLLAWLRLAQTPDLRRGAALGVVLAVAVVSCLYYGLFLALAVGVLSLVGLRGLWTRPGWGRSHALAAALGLAAAVAVGASVRGPGQAPSAAEPVSLAAYVLQEGLDQPLLDPPETRLDPWELVRPANGLRDEVGWGALAYGGGRYVGLPLLLLALVGLVLEPRRAWPWALVGGIGVVLASGSYLVLDGEPVTAGGGRLRMPLLYLNRFLEHAVRGLHYPARFLALTITSLAALAALATRPVLRGLPLLWPAVALAGLSAAEVQVHQLVPGPQPRFDFQRFDGLAKLQDNPGAVLDLSYVGLADHRAWPRSIAAQLAHGQPIQGIPLERVEARDARGRAFVKALPMVAALAPALSGRAAAPSPEAYRQDFALLRSAGFRYVLALSEVEGQAVQAELRKTLTGLLGEPLAIGPEFVVHVVPTLPTSAVELKRWQAEHQARMASLTGD